jgi:hypothetical protein
MSATVSAEPSSARRSTSMLVGWRANWSWMNSSSWIAIAAHLIGLAQAQGAARVR